MLLQLNEFANGTFRALNHDGHAFGPPTVFDGSPQLTDSGLHEFAAKTEVFRFSNGLRS